MKRKTYIEVPQHKILKNNYPQFESLGNGVFGYKDIIKINNNVIWISFLCQQNGIPLEGIWNSYFSTKEQVDTKSPFWLIHYKQELLNKIIEDLENKKQKER